MDDPTPEPNIQEVNLPKAIPGNRSTKDTDLQPLRGGSMMDIDDEGEEKVRQGQGGSAKVRQRQGASVKVRRVREGQ